MESDSVTAPLPHFGASWTYAFTPTLAADVQLLGFAIELDNIDGSLLELSADLAWQPWEHFGFGAGLRYFNANVKGGDADLNGEFDLEYFGASISVIATFWFDAARQYSFSEVIDKSISRCSVAAAAACLQSTSATTQDFHLTRSADIRISSR